MIVRLVKEGFGDVIEFFDVNFAGNVINVILDLKEGEDDNNVDLAENGLLSAIVYLSDGLDDFMVCLDGVRRVLF